MRDIYASVSSLMEVEAPYVEIHWRATQRSRLAVVAPHAGRIEPATGELAVAIAGNEYRVYCFSGRARKNNLRLHVTSTRFAERYLDEVLRGALAIVSVHGCRDPHESVTLIGGTNHALRQCLAAALSNSGFNVDRARPPMAGLHPRNVTNRALTGGVQLEISRAQREGLLHQRSGVSGNHELGCVCGFCRYVRAIRRGLGQFERPGISPD